MTSFYESLKTFLFEPTSHFAPPHVPLRPLPPDALKVLPVTRPQRFLVSPRGKLPEIGGEQQPVGAELFSGVKIVLTQNADIDPSSSSECEVFQPKAEVLCLPKSPFKLELGEEAQLRAERPEQEDCATQRQDKLSQFLPEANMVCENIYISGYIPAQDVSIMEKYNIRAVLNLCGDVMREPANPSLCNFIIKVKDGATEQISNIFYECFAFIHYFKQRGENVLIHCHQGVSRSSTITLAYLMLSNDLNFLEAFAHLRVCRSIVTPNSGFICQLVEWWTFRHQNSVSFIRCKNISHQLKLDLQFDIDQAAQKESAVRDMMDNKLVKCVPPVNEDVIKPIVFRLTFLFADQPLLVLKQVRRPIDDKYVLDSRFIYIISEFHNVTCILVGDDVQGETQDIALDEFCLSAGSSPGGSSVGYDCFNDKHDQPELWKQWLKNPVNPLMLFDDQQRKFEEMQGQFKAIDLNCLLKRALARQLLLMIYFEHFSERIIVYQQDEMLEHMEYGKVDPLFAHLGECLGWCSSYREDRFSYALERTPVETLDFSAPATDEIKWEPQRENDDEFSVLQKVIM